jgi:hypothetical protein
MNPVTLNNMAAAPGTLEAYAFVGKFNDIILFPLIILLTGIAFLVFLYGCLIYITHSENSSAREQGRSHIIYSLIGMFIMLVAYAILQIAANTFGLGDMLDCANNPNTPGCNEIMRIPNPEEGPLTTDPGVDEGPLTTDPDVDEGSLTN